MAIEFGFNLNLTIPVPAGYEIKDVQVSVGQPVYHFSRPKEAEIELDIETIQVTADRNRQLRAHWSEEAEEDLRAWHNIPSKAEPKRQTNWKKEGF